MTTVTPTFAKAIRQSGALRGLQENLNLPPVYAYRTENHSKWRSSLRSNSAQASAHNIIHRVAPTPRPKTVLPSSNLDIKTPRRLFTSNITRPPTQKEKCVTEPRVGILAPKAISKRAIGHAETRLCKLRIKLNHLLHKDDPKYRQDNGTLKPWVKAKARMLGVMDMEGYIDYMPDPEPSEDYEHPDIIEATREELFRPSPLKTVQRMVPQDEIMYSEYGLLPTEQRNVGFEMDVEIEIEMLGEEQRQEDAMDYMRSAGKEFPGSRLEGPWREIQGPQVAFEVSIAAEWAWREDMYAARAREGAMMDPRCRSVVEGVWAMGSRS